MINDCFDTPKYLSHQIEAFRERLVSYQGPTIIEFGGKPYDDQHASRVLPGYLPNCKIDLLRELNINGDICMCLNAQDVFPEPTGRYLNGRIRGDSGLKYLDESLRMIYKANDLGVGIPAVVLTATPHGLDPQEQDTIGQFQTKLSKEGIGLKITYKIKDYPDPKILEQTPFPFDANDDVGSNSENLILLSPGGGSGKFSVALSEFYKHTISGNTPNFIKFETFPVFRLDKDHPLNLAYMAASADLHNVTYTTSSGLTCYDKDKENFELLQALVNYLLLSDHPVAQMNGPTDLSVNVVEKGITNMDQVIEASGIEIQRRIKRYTLEVERGDEKVSTLERTKQLLEIYNSKKPKGKESN